MQEIWAKLLAYNLTELLVSHTVIDTQDTKHTYMVNFTVAAHICRIYLRLTAEIDSIDVMSLLKKELIPIRNDRQYPRLKTAHFRRPMDDYKKRRLTAILKSAGLPMTAEVYLSMSIVKAGLIFAGVIPCLLILPLAAPAILILGIAVYFKESSRAEQMVIKRRNEIEYELPRFAATLSQQLKASRDVLSILESYQRNAGVTFREELVITIADMSTGNYEGALTRLEGRVSSAMLSDVVRGLIGVLRGDDGIAFFVMLSHDMKQLEVQRLKKQALERPPKIRRYSFLLLAAMVLLYMGVIGYQILGTMSGLL